jgi:integrase
VLEYLEYAQASKAASTYSADKYRIEGHLMPYFEDTLLTMITPQMVDNYKATRIRDGASAKTVVNELVNLSHMFKMAVRWRYIDQNVVAMVEKPRVINNPPRFLNREEIDQLINAAHGYYIYPLIVTALHTGMRKAELLNLKWLDIDFRQQTVTVQSKRDWHTKNYKSRTLQLTPVLYSVLNEHEQEQKRLGVKSDYTFTYRGNRIQDGIKKSLVTVVKEAGLEGVTLHTFRHTFASQLVMAGVSLMEVQKLMGHESFETTLRYAHLSEDHVKKQVLRLPFANG